LVYIDLGSFSLLITFFPLLVSSVFANNSIYIAVIDVIAIIAKRTHFYVWVFLNTMIVADNSSEELLVKVVKLLPQEFRMQLVPRMSPLGKDFSSGSE
jgi:hypothetical protein